MFLLDHHLVSPEESASLDERLLISCNQECNHHVTSSSSTTVSAPKGILRFWEADRYFVVLGRSKKIEDDVFLEACQNDHIPIVRRCSGGGTVLQGPGCLNYAIIQPISSNTDTIQKTNATVMKQHADVFSRTLSSPISVSGITDLTCDQRKFSGNAQRRLKYAFLFHGTFLYHFDIAVGHYIVYAKN